MITGAHVILYSSDAEADRAFLRDLLDTATVDAGGGWLIFALPSAEVAVHPTGSPVRHELYLMCDDIEETLADLAARDVAVEGGISDQGWGRFITILLPSGAPLSIYEPSHPVVASR